MTEQEWRECNSPWRIVPLLGNPGRHRKSNLLCAACLRRIWSLLPGPKSRCAVEILEQFAEGMATEETLKKARQEAWEDANLDHNPERKQNHIEATISAVVMEDVLSVLSATAQATGWGKLGNWETNKLPEYREQSVLVREVFGNPFKPASIDASWQTSTTLALAKAAYEQRAMPSGELDPTLLAILADALEDAGCTDLQILNHCRRLGVHVRGCWVVDLLLGKE